MLSNRALLALALAVALGGPASALNASPRLSLPGPIPFGSPALPALRGLCLWLLTPEANTFLMREPSLAHLPLMDLSKARARAAAAPLVERLPAQTLGELAALETLPEDRRARALEALLEAHREAAASVEAEAARVSEALRARVQAGASSPEELETAASELDGYVLYGGGVRRAAVLFRETASALRSGKLLAAAAAMAEGLR